MLSVCVLLWFGRGGCSLVPLPFLTCQATSSDKGLVWILGETPHAICFLNFGVGVPLKIHTRPKGLGMDGGGDP
ncbi:unnamed protein product, partial [Staurois parvus]